MICSHQPEMHGSALSPCGRGRREAPAEGALTGCYTQTPQMPRTPHPPTSGGSPLPQGERAGTILRVPGAPITGPARGPGGPITGLAFGHFYPFAGHPPGMLARLRAPGAPITDLARDLGGLITGLAFGRFYPLAGHPPGVLARLRAPGAPITGLALGLDGPIRSLALGHPGPASGPTHRRGCADVSKHRPRR